VALPAPSKSGLSAAPEVVVIIVAFNSGPHLQRVLDALERQTFADFEAIVWDNASTDGVVDVLTVGPRVRIVRCPENLGFAAGNNRAAALSRAPLIVTLNPDAFAEPAWLERLVAAAHRHRAQSVGSLQLSDADDDVLDGAGDVMSIAGVAWRGGYLGPLAWAPSGPVEIFAPCAAAALYRRDAFEAVGGFDERFFCYHEDVDLGFRLRLRGGISVMEPAAVVRHIGSASSKTISGFAEYHGMRNRLWTFVRDMPLALMPLALPSHILIVLFVLARSQDAPMRAARWRGLRDGLRGMGAFIRERRDWPAADLGAVARMLSWNPLALRQRRPIYRALKA
jgi:GT2 family glycosyltransferase